MSIILLAAAFVGGAVVGCGSWAAFKAKASADAKALLADAKAEAGKVAPSALAIVAKIEAALAKL